MCLRGSRLRRLRMILLAFLACVIFFWDSKRGAPSFLASGGVAAAGRAASSQSSVSAPEAAPRATLVWVLLGDTHFQAYILESMRQAKLLNPESDLWLVCDEEFLPEKVRESATKA